MQTMNTEKVKTSEEKTIGLLDKDLSLYTYILSFYRCLGPLTYGGKARNPREKEGEIQGGIVFNDHSICITDTLKMVESKDTAIIDSRSKHFLHRGEEKFNHNQHRTVPYHCISLAYLSILFIKDDDN